MNNEELETIFSADKFYFTISSYGVVPKFNPNYDKNRVIIKISDNKKLENIAEIENKKYELYGIDVDFIKKYTEKNFEELLNIANQIKYDPFEMIDGYVNEVKIKLGSVFINIYTNISTIPDEHKVIIHNFITKIIGFIQSSDRLDYYKKIYKEKFNKDIVYNMANNEDIFRVINECIEKNIDAETYYSKNIKYDENVDY